MGYVNQVSISYLFSKLTVTFNSNCNDQEVLRPTASITTQCKMTNWLYTESKEKVARNYQNTEELKISWAANYQIKYNLSKSLTNSRQMLFRHSNNHYNGHILADWSNTRVQMYQAQSIVASNSCAKINKHKLSKS